MKTDELIDLLAASATPVASNAASRRVGAALAAGLAGTALMLSLTFGVQPGLAQPAAEPMFWFKLLFAGSLVAAAAVGMERLGRPGLRLGGTRVALVLPLAALWLLALAALVSAPPSHRLQLVMGSTWRWCPGGIALLSLPAFAAGLWALRGLAPTRPALAGAMAGLQAGALGALLYALHCTELAAPFVAVWYVAGDRKSVV